MCGCHEDPIPADWDGEYGRCVKCGCTEDPDMRYESFGPVCNPDGSASDVTKAMLAGTGRDPEEFAHTSAVLARHEAAFGDEHDEDCPLCGVDAQSGDEA